MIECILWDYHRMSVQIKTGVRLTAVPTKTDEVQVGPQVYRVMKVVFVASQPAVHLYVAALRKDTGRYNLSDITKKDGG